MADTASHRPRANAAPGPGSTPTAAPAPTWALVLGAGLLLLALWLTVAGPRLTDPVAGGRAPVRVATQPPVTAAVEEALPVGG